MRKPFLILALVSGAISSVLHAQCKVELNEVDEFDSTQTVISQPVNVGYSIASNYQTADGFKMIEEGKILFSYIQNDSINGFFLVLGLAERDFHVFEEGYNVLIKFKDPNSKGNVDPALKTAQDSLAEKLPEDDILGFFTVPDRGVFDRNTNMRIYTLTCVIPLDKVFILSYYLIDKIRINFKGYKHTLSLTPPQQQAVTRAVRCVGEAAKLLPVRP